MSNAELNMPAVLAPGLGALDRARWMTRKLTDDLTEDQCYARPCDGGNHAAWVLGHAASTDDFFLNAMGGQASKLPEGWGVLFGMNSEVSDDRSRYPSIEELRSVMTERREALKSWLGSLSEAELLEPVEGDLAKFAATRAELPASLGFHEGFHAGQISMARRAAGMAPLF